MLTSPVIINSASASPTSFRYAPAPVVSTVSGPNQRRSSSRPTLAATPAMTSPASLRTKRTGPASPTESQTMAGHHDLRSSGSQSVPKANPSTTPGVQPQPQEPTATPPNPPPSVSSASRDAQLQSLSSPNKRRGSPSRNTSPSTTQSEQPTLTDGSPASSSTKRAKSQAPPPKTLPRQYEFCAVEDMVELIAHMLGELITTNDAIRISEGGLTRFHSRTAPGISVRDYLHRLARHATLTPPLLLAMVYYIDRLCAMYNDFTINTLTVHRFLITAATVAAKGLSDSFWNNTTYARVGGIRLAELSRLELEFLHRVDWKIVPNPEVLVAYYKGLIERTPGYILEPGDDSEEESEEASSSGDELGEGTG
ncbi:unnamed protein product [Clonostachys rhizophaga]|uniref:Nuc-1 negative regulatory protein preg n=1 Tax=Clonostachys rhizophaga TaxID=160324 RepID=A0A9N9YV58_9HYPO|nr:unnamed protein product [Clonostachys rhizophaga]